MADHQGDAAPATNTSSSGSTKLWGGRFAKDTDMSIVPWTESITIDRHLAVEDIWGSLAHNSMLGHQGIVGPREAAGILGRLLQLQNDYIDGKWQLGLQMEDVHMNVERLVIDSLGMDVGGRMHTCRSRNDQVVLDSKLYCRRRLLELRGRVCDAVEALLKRAAQHTEDVMPSYTHVQHAQPVSVAYWLSSYAGVMLRDLERLTAAYNTTDQNPLGAGAIAGTSFPIDRSITCDFMGFQSIQEHGLDATSARDFMLETLSAVSTLYTSLSRLGEEFVLWSSYEFRTIVLSDAFAMGSSMMPQKKNPGALELLRGRSGRVNGLLVAGFTMMKGLPSGYNRDFHEDKEILVEQLTLVNRAVEVIPSLINSTTINTQRMAELAGANFSTATELANYLVSKHNVPFRKAHHISGSLVGELYRAGQNFDTNRAHCYAHLRANGIQASNDEIDRVLDPKQVMLSYESQGGTGKNSVTAMLKSMNERLVQHRAVLARDQQRVDRAYNAVRAFAADVSRELATNKPLTLDEFRALLAKHRAALKQ